MTRSDPTATPPPASWSAAAHLVTAVGVAMCAVGLSVVGVIIAAVGLSCAAVLTVRARAIRDQQVTELTAGAETQRRILETLSDAVVLLDASGHVLQVNTAACRLFGVACVDAIANPSAIEQVEFVDRMGRAVPAADTPFRRARHGEIVDGIVLGIDHTDGERVWSEFSIQRVQDGGRPVLVLVAHDVTDQVNSDMASEAETAQLRHRALHDSLTGLPNRTMLMDRLSHARLNAERRGAGTGLVVIDLDGFKGVNDTLGHAAGDEVLVQVAVRLRTALRAADTAARLGGDEFVVLCEDLNPGMADLELGRIAERIKSLLNQPYITTLGPAEIGASLGWAVAGPEEELTLELVTQADEAMLTDKRQRKQTRSSRMRTVRGPLPKASTKELTVYIVDDDPAMRLLANRIIESDPTNGLKVVGESGDGSAAIDEIPSLKPDLVLCDVMMPGVSGPHVVTALREQLPAQLIIFWSATTAPELERYKADLGVPYVLKDRIEELPIALLEAAAEAAQSTVRPVAQF